MSQTPFPTGADNTPQASGGRRNHTVTKEALAFLAIALANASPDANRQAIGTCCGMRNQNPSLHPARGLWRIGPRKATVFFHELDIPSRRIYDPYLVETLRSA